MDIHHQPLKSSTEFFERHVTSITIPNPMIAVLFIPGLAGNSMSQPDIAAVRPLPVAAVPSDSADLAWSVTESADVYCSAVKVAVAIGEANGEGSNYTGCHDCAMLVLEAARAYAAESGIGHLRIIAGLADVATVIERNTSPFDGPFAGGEDWWKHDARLASILLPVICRVYETQIEHEKMLAKIREEIAREGVRKPPQGGVMDAKEAMAEFRRMVEENFEGRGPVTIFDDRVVVECDPEHPGPVWAVPLADIQTPARLLKWVADLSTKRWCTREMVNDFVGMVTTAKGWNIYAADG